MRAIGLVAALLIVVGFQPALADTCKPSITAGELSSEGFRLSYVTLSKHDSQTGKNAAVDAFYFVNNSCECGFSAPDGLTFTKNEVAAASSGGKGLRQLAKRLADMSGSCPMQMTNSPYFYCFGNFSKPCKEANR